MGSSHSFNSSTGDNLFTATGRRKMNIILELQNEFPRRLRHTIREANNNHKNSRNKSNRKNPKIFLSQVQDAFAIWLFEAALSEDLSGCLNDKHDMEQQVELALRFFPKVLSLQRYGLFPIFWLCRSIRSVSFIPLFARLGVELGLFQEYERGGLVFGTNGTNEMDVFSQLAATTCREDNSNSNSNNLNKREHQEIVDAKFLAVIKKLRKSKLMKKSDIYKYKMIDILCNNKNNHQSSVFPEKRFRYLVDWDPIVLLSNNGRGKSPKTLSVRLISRFIFADTYNDKDKGDMTGLRMLFELSMKYYPAELGFLFDTIYSVDDGKKPSICRKKKPSKKRSLDEGSNHSRGGGDNDNHVLDFENSTSLFQFACDTHGKKVVQGIVDDLLYFQMTKDVNFTRKALLRAATASCESETEGAGGSAKVIFLLMKRDPTLFRLVPTTN
jgi:hypothetical protein